MTIDEIKQEIDKNGFCLVDSLYWLCSKDWLIEEQKGWSEWDKAKHVCFDCHEYWVIITAVDFPPLGYDSIEEAVGTEEKWVSSYKHFSL